MHNSISFCSRFHNIEQIIVHITKNRHNPEKIFTDDPKSDLSFDDVNQIHAFFAKKLANESPYEIKQVLIDLNNSYFYVLKKLTDAAFKEENNLTWTEWFLDTMKYVMQHIFVFVADLSFKSILLIISGFISYLLINEIIKNVNLPVNMNHN